MAKEQYKVQSKKDINRVIVKGVPKDPEDKRCPSYEVIGSEVELENFKNWVKDYRKGTIVKDTILCKKPTDLKACRLCAMRRTLVVNAILE